MTTRYQKRHYKDVAGILRLHRAASGAEWTGRIVVEEIVKSFTTLFAADNSLFDRERFLAACGLESGG